MKVPNADRAVIAEDKLRLYLLNPAHKRGGSKARLLLSLGYHSSEPQRLADDLRQQHLTRDADASSSNAYGVVFELRGPLITPSGRSVAFRSIWQIDTGTDVPRLITMYPD